MNGLKWIACAAVIAGALVATSKEARADVMVAADLDLGVPVNASTTRMKLVPFGATPGIDQVALGTGAGFDGRFGFRFIIPRRNVSITPELAIGYTNLGASIVRVRPGMRVGFGRLLVPYVYGHVGWGWSSWDASPLSSSTTQQGTTPAAPTNLYSRDAQGAAFDAGVGLDVSVTRRFTVGAHIGYNTVNIRNDFLENADPAGARSDWVKWFNFGLNASFYF